MKRLLLLARHRRARPARDGARQGPVRSEDHRARASRKAIKIIGAGDRRLADHGSRRRSRLLPGRVRPDAEPDDVDAPEGRPRPEVLDRLRGSGRRTSRTSRSTRTSIRTRARSAVTYMPAGPADLRHEDAWRLVHGLEAEGDPRRARAAEDRAARDLEQLELGRVLLDREDRSPRARLVRHRSSGQC